ncbi:hypothetical protein HMPREF0724_10385 [Prescottella equi ATCC 33707]|uniref:Uncharacterized protein n=1 Tax=Prescottella equi ATCC 33707 TaxID=525370 RepID=E9SW85_RHOHA|nr:hypothetical protein HMPREF0724_10385 [Prescottella equi ATCC 33707]
MDLSVRVEAWTTDLRRWPRLCREAGAGRPRTVPAAAGVDVCEAA